MATEEKVEESSKSGLIDPTLTGHVKTKRVRRRTGYPIEFLGAKNIERNPRNEINKNNITEELSEEVKTTTMREKSPSELNQKQSTNPRKTPQRKVKYNPVRLHTTYIYTVLGSYTGNIFRL